VIKPFPHNSAPTTSHGRRGLAFWTCVIFFSKLKFPLCCLLPCCFKFSLPSGYLLSPPPTALQLPHVIVMVIQQPQARMQLIHQYQCMERTTCPGKPTTTTTNINLQGKPMILKPLVMLEFIPLSSPPGHVTCHMTMTHATQQMHLP